MGRIKLPKLRNGGKEDSNLASLGWESDILPLNNHAPHIGVRANIHLGGQTKFCPNGFGGGGGSSRNFPGSIFSGGGGGSSRHSTLVSSY